MSVAKIFSKRLRNLSPRFWLGALMLVATGASAKANLPFTLVNNSPYPDDQVYVAILGQIGTDVWIDPATSEVHQMSQSDNTIPGPVLGGNKGPGGKGLYANCFRRLSELPTGGVINMPEISSTRIFFAFGSQLYMYFFGGGHGGYAAPDINNPNDPNQGILFEFIELTNNSGGIYANTTRVDAFFYPMGVELWGGQGYYVKTGEIAADRYIVDKWKSSVSPAFQGCLRTSTGIIQAPSKIADFQTGGAQAEYFKAYVDAIWAKYANEDLIFTGGGSGDWKGRVEGERFVFHSLRSNPVDNGIAIITRRPNTQEVLEGKGVLAENVQHLPGTLDLVVQALFCAALNRHALDLSTPAGIKQNWEDTSRFFKTAPYNEYVKFWHRPDISWDRLSYGFCYDDVSGQSATLATSSPTAVKVSLGGFTTVASIFDTRSTPIGCRAQLDATRTRISGFAPGASQLKIVTAAGSVAARASLTEGSAKLTSQLPRGTYLWTQVGDRTMTSGTLLVP